MLLNLISLIKQAQTNPKNDQQENKALNDLLQLLDGRVTDRVIFEQLFWVLSRNLSETQNALKYEMASFVQQMDQLYSEVMKRKSILEHYLSLKRKPSLDQSTLHGQSPIVLPPANIYRSLMADQLTHAVSQQDAYRNVNRTLQTLRTILAAYDKVALDRAKPINNFDTSDKILLAKNCLENLVNPVDSNESPKALLKEIRDVMLTLYESNTLPVLPSFKDEKAQQFDRDILRAMSITDPDRSFAKDKMKLELQAYIKLREAEAAKANSIYNTFFGRLFGLSEKVKIAAAKNMIKALDGEAVRFSEEDFNALRDSRLNKIISKYENIGALPETFHEQERRYAHRYVMVRSHR